VAEGAVKLDGEAVSDISLVVPVTSERKLSLGKKKHGVLLP
jgi:tyrosyl-tRNA synthetase